MSELVCIEVSNKAPKILYIYKRLGPAPRGMYLSSRDIRLTRSLIISRHAELPKWIYTTQILKQIYICRSPIG